MGQSQTPTLTTTMSQVRVHAAFTVPKEHEAEFLAAAKVMVQATQAEAGCEHYQLYKEAGKEGSYAMIETWQSQETLKALGGSQHIKDFQAAMKDKITTVVQFFTPL